MASELRKNIVANYAGQFYVSVIGIIILPLYSKILGAESFGLVAFFSVIQAAFAILDLGLSPTISRETVKFRAKSVSALSYTHFLRSVSVVFIFIAMTGFLLIYAFSNLISQKWITAVSIGSDEIALCISIMGAVAALRWYSALHRGVLIGYEDFVWFNAYNVFFSTVRYIFVIPIILFYSENLAYYFLYQFSVSILEVFTLRRRARKLNRTGSNFPYSISKMFKELRSRFMFTSSIAFTSIIWMMVVNVDKIYASSVLDLKDYGYFIMIVSLASGLMLVSSPISSALLPRLTSISESSNEDFLYEKYSHFTKMTINLVMPICFYMVFFSNHIIKVWTQSNIITSFGTDVLILYSMGYIFLVLASIPYRLQYAKGNLRYHVIATTLFLLVHAPLVYFLTRTYGAVGSGAAWLISNALNFSFLAFFVHPKLIGKKSISWVCVSVIVPFMKSLFLIFLLFVISSWIFNDSIYIVLSSGALVALYLYFFQVKKGLLND